MKRKYKIYYIVKKIKYRAPNEETVQLTTSLFLARISRTEISCTDNFAFFFFGAALLFSSSSDFNESSTDLKNENMRIVK